GGRALPGEPPALLGGEPEAEETLAAAAGAQEPDAEEAARLNAFLMGVDDLPFERAVLSEEAPESAPPEAEGVAGAESSEPPRLKPEAQARQPSSEGDEGLQHRSEGRCQLPDDGYLACA